MLRITCAAFAGLLSLAAQADGISGDVGAGVSYQPHDPTGSRYETRPVPYLDLDWGNVSLSTDDGLSWSALNTQGLSAGPYINYLQGRTSNGSLQGLRNVSDMAEVGGFIQYAPADFWRVYAQLGQAVGGGGIPRAARWARSAVSLVTRWAVESSAAAAWWRTLPMHGRPRRFSGWMTTKRRPTGFKAYNASGGFQNVTLSQSFQFPLAPNWSLLTSASWVHLVGSAADSSIVKQTGDVNQGQVQTAISYTFD